MSLANFAFVFLFFIPTTITKNLILTRINKNNKEYLINGKRNNSTFQPYV